MGKFIIKKIGDEVKFDLVTGSGEVIAASSVYDTVESCRHSIELIRENASMAAVEDHTDEQYIPREHPKFDLYRDKAGDYRFRLKISGGEVVAVSLGYPDLTDCLRIIETIQNSAADAEIVEEL